MISVALQRFLAGCPLAAEFNDAVLLVQEPPVLRTFWPSAERLVAIGDLHGDMGKARRALRLGGLIDDNDRWCGGSTTAVQVELGFEDVSMIQHKIPAEHIEFCICHALCIALGGHSLACLMISS